MKYAEPSGFLEFAEECDASGNPEGKIIAHCLRKIVETIDIAQYNAATSHFTRLVQMTRHFSERDMLQIIFRGEDDEKFLFLLPWIMMKMDYILKMKVHEMPPSSVLDIGSGAGHFLLLCRALGHDVHGLDIPAPVFDTCCEFFRIPRTIARIEPMTPLPDFGRRFDLMTAFLVDFSRKENSSWDEEEWLFFFKDLVSNHINENGRIFMEINEHRNLTGGIKPSSEQGRAFFENLGGRWEYNGMNWSVDIPVQKLSQNL